MANYTVDRAKHATLAASTQDVVTVNDFGERIEVMNVNGSASIYFTDDGTDVTAAKQDNTYVLPAVAGASFILELPKLSAAGEATIKLFSTGTPDYAVTMLPSNKRVRD